MRLGEGDHRIRQTDDAKRLRRQNPDRAERRGAATGDLAFGGLDIIEHPLAMGQIRVPSAVKLTFGLSD